MHLISSDKPCSKKKSKRVLYIPNKYEFVFENGAQSWAAVLAEHLVLQNMSIPLIVIRVKATSPLWLKLSHAFHTLTKSYRSIVGLC